jgi:hypothetical protein
VLKTESDEIVDAIKKKDGVVEYVVFDNEGHGFTKKENELRASGDDTQRSYSAFGPTKRSSISSTSTSGARRDSLKGSW